MRKTVIQTAILIGLASATTSMAGAASAFEGPKAHVEIADLDLSNAADASLFEARVAAEGKTFCAAREKLGAEQLSVPRAACVAHVRKVMLKQLRPSARHAVQVAAASAATTIAAR